MITLTVRELIEALEELPQDYPVVADNMVVSDVVIRDELYSTEEGFYDEGLVVKLI